MGWMEGAKRALFGDGGVLGYLSVSKKNSPSANDPAVSTDVVVVIADVPAVPLSELDRATNSFSRERLVGQGSRSAVYRATLPRGRAAAAKKLQPPPSGCWDASAVAMLKQQVSVAWNLRHENVVRLLGYTIVGDLRVVLYEFATMGTLHDVLHGPRGVARKEQPAGAGRGGTPAAGLSWAQRVQIALDIARGLEYLHEGVRPAVMHGDVRSSNVLLFAGLRAKLADFDLFKEAPEHAEYTRVHIRHIRCQAPEFVMTGGRTVKSDVFSFGVVLLELLTGKKPNDRTLPPGQHIVLNWALPLLTEGRVEECIDPKLGAQYPPAGAIKLGRIAVRCLQQGPRVRPSMGTVAGEIEFTAVPEGPGRQ